MAAFVKENKKLLYAQNQIMNEQEILKILYTKILEDYQKLNDYITQKQEIKSLEIDFFETSEGFEEESP
jgi:hypothetical protein